MDRAHIYVFAMLVVGDFGVNTPVSAHSTNKSTHSTQQVIKHRGSTALTNVDQPRAWPHPPFGLNRYGEMKEGRTGTDGSSTNDWSRE